MKILYNKIDGRIMVIAHRLEYGIFDEPDVEKWAVYNEDDVFQNVFYLGRDLISSDISAENIPEDWESGRYLFVNGEFVLNPDWHEPEPPVEEKVAALQEKIEELMGIIEIQSEALDYLIMNNM